MEVGESIVPSCGIVGEDTRRTLRKIKREKTKTQDVNTKDFGGKEQERKQRYLP